MGEKTLAPPDFRAERPASNPPVTQPPWGLSPGVFDAISEYQSSPDPSPPADGPVTRAEYTALAVRVGALAGHFRTVFAELEAADQRRDERVTQAMAALRSGIQEVGTTVHTEIHEIDLQIHQIKHAIKNIQHHGGLVTTVNVENDKSLKNELLSLRHDVRKGRYYAPFAALAFLLIEVVRLVMHR